MASMVYSTWNNIDLGRRCSTSQCTPSCTHRAKPRKTIIPPSPPNTATDLNRCREEKYENSKLEIVYFVRTISLATVGAESTGGGSPSPIGRTGLSGPYRSCGAGFGSDIDWVEPWRHGSPGFRHASLGDQKSAT
jgi:hypothetical protein